ncbi:SHOCT domain-containing protein [Haloarcula brevis]|uniref:SHOCT domain-containing protein n=1 Tax=Haloarcula brevis TaxID=3111453 RepID=UPI00300F53CE
MSNLRTTDGTVKLILVVLAILVLGPMLMMVLAFPLMGMWGGGMMGGYGMYGGSWTWGFGMMLFWLVILIGGGYLVYRWLSGGGGLTADPALEELRIAYARGDISEEEYEQRRSKLDGE